MYSQARKTEEEDRIDRFWFYNEASLHIRYLRVCP